MSCTVQCSCVPPSSGPIHLGWHWHEYETICLVWVFGQCRVQYLMGALVLLHLTQNQIGNNAVCRVACMRRKTLLIVWQSKQTKQEKAGVLSVFKRGEHQCYSWIRGWFYPFFVTFYISNFDSFVLQRWAMWVMEYVPHHSKEWRETNTFGIWPSNIWEFWWVLYLPFKNYMNSALYDMFKQW